MSWDANLEGGTQQMRFIVRPISIIAVLLGAVGLGCGNEPAEPTPEVEDYDVVFTAAPLLLTDVVAIVPLGSLNPPDHTIPNDHVQFAYLDRCPCDFRPRPVFAPGRGTVRLVLRGQDDGLEVGAPPDLPGSEDEPWYYMGHILLNADIQVGRQVLAGEQIGVTGPHAVAVDLGVVHPDVDNFFVVRDRYHAKALYGDKPLRYFTEPLKSQLYALVQREGTDKDGKFDYDIAGRLRGVWFHETLPMDNRSTGPEGWSRNLAFVPWERDPSVPFVVSGGTILPPLVYWIGDGGPNFEDVAVSSGPVTYRLYGSRPTPASSPDYVVLLQLVNDLQLRVEVFPASIEPVAFTANAVTYRR
jgi:hypothetical protein